MKDRKRRTVRQGRQMVREYLQSGLTQRGFSEKSGISLAVLNYWVVRIRKEPVGIQRVPAVNFVEIKAKPVEQPQIVEVALPGGLVMKSTAFPNAAYLAELSQEYQRRSAC